MAGSKDDKIEVRISEHDKSDFKKVAAYRGLKPAVLLHQLIIETINGEKENRPHIFDISQESSSENDEETFQIPAYQGKFEKKKDEEKAS